MYVYELYDHEMRPTAKREKINLPSPSSQTLGNKCQNRSHEEGFLVAWKLIAIKAVYND